MCLPLEKPRCSCNHSLLAGFQLLWRSPTEVFGRFVVETHFEDWLRNVFVLVVLVRSRRNFKGRISELVVLEVSRLLPIRFVMFFRSTENQVSLSSKSISRTRSTSSIGIGLLKRRPKCLRVWNGGLGGVITSHLYWCTTIPDSSFLSLGFSRVTLSGPCTSAVVCRP